MSALSLRLCHILLRRSPEQGTFFYFFCAPLKGRLSMKPVPNTHTA